MKKPLHSAALSFLPLALILSAPLAMLTSNSLEAHASGGNRLTPVTPISEATGDLNGDGRPDKAVIVPAGESAKLMIMLQGKDGKYKLAAESSKAVMAACGPSGGIPTVTIKQGVLSVGHYCGSRSRYEFTHKYQWRQNKWLLIGFTGETVDTAIPDSTQKIDINFVTGDVEDFHFKGKQKHSEHFLEVRAPHIVAPTPTITDWSVPRIVLRPLSKSAPAIATQAVFNDKQLFIRVQCDPPGSTLPKKIWLTTADNKTIQPSAIEPSPTYGYVLAKFDLTAPLMKSAATKVTDWSSDKAHKVLRLTLQVDPGDSTPVLSTSRTHAGAILLSNAHEPLTLTDIDVENGSLPHPFMYAFPDLP